MKRAIQKHIKDFIAIVVIAVLAVLVGGYVLSNQRFYLPAWVPIVGSDFVDYNAEFATAQAVTPGQGQTVQVAGVPIGEIGQVSLKDGRAVVQMKIRKKYTPIYKDATALLRPKTGLNDMVVELDPGNRSAGAIPVDGAIPVGQTSSNVNPDEILAGLDVDTRDYLRLLAAGGGAGLAGNSRQLSATLKRFDPTARYLARVGKALSVRQANIKRSIRNFRLLSEALGDQDTNLARFVTSSNEVFQAFAAQEGNLSETLSLLPTALQKTNSALGKSQVLTEQLGPTLNALLPTARGLAPALESFQTFATDTTPVIKNQLRPFTKVAQPTAAALRPAAADLAATTPQLDQALGVVNALFNQLAYNPPGKQEGFLYWLSWGNHAAASMFGSQDAHGPTRRGLVIGSCSSLLTLERIGSVNPVLGTLAALLNAPKTSEVCNLPAAAAAKKKGASAAAKPQLKAQGLSATPPSGASTKAAAPTGAAAPAAPAATAGASTP